MLTVKKARERKRKREKEDGVVVVIRISYIIEKKEEEPVRIK